VGSHVHKMLTQHLPDARPDKSDSSHVEVCNFDQSLQAELARIYGIGQLLSRNLAEILNEQDDCVLV